MTQEDYVPTFLEGSDLSSKCSRCNRALKDPVSMRYGIGPTCRRKLGINVKPPRGSKSQDTTIDKFDYETMDITFRRVGTLGIVNVHQAFKHHSHTGMEWGYPGSGAADLALNILARFLPMKGKGKKNGVELSGSAPGEAMVVSRLAWDHHQAFKAEFIATMNYSGGRIEGRKIVEWLMDQGISIDLIAIPESMKKPESDD